MAKKGRSRFHYSYKPVYQQQTSSSHGGVSPSSLSHHHHHHQQQQPTSTEADIGSVNRELQRLRKTTIYIADDDRNNSSSSNNESGFDAALLRLSQPAPTTHPSLNSILSPSSAITYIPPRPRNQRGYVAPDSWRAASLARQQLGEAPEGDSVADFNGSPLGVLPSRVASYTLHGTYYENEEEDEALSFPGLPVGERSSLMHCVLKAMADNWDFHVDYDGEYLWMLRGGLKSLLAAYIARRTLGGRPDNENKKKKGGGSVLTAKNLKVLFERRKGWTEENQNGAATYDENGSDGVPMEPIGTDEIIHMDLSGALGRGLEFKDLTALFRPPHSSTTTTNDMTTTTATTTITSKKSSSSRNPSTPPQQPAPIPETWEEELESSLSNTSISTSTTTTNNTSNNQQQQPPSSPKFPPSLQLTSTMFPSLTHLSLAYPVNSESLFTHLQKFTSRSYIPTITHLNLSGWQTVVSPKSGIASRSVVLEHFASYFRRLSRSLLCLQYLDVSDCNRVVYQSLQEVEWNGCWRGVVTVVARQNIIVVGNGGGNGKGKERGHGGYDEGEELRGLRMAEVASLEETVRRIRREGKGGWCRFVTWRE